MNVSQQSVDVDAVVASRDSLEAALDTLATVIQGHADVIRPENAPVRALSVIREEVAGLQDRLTNDRLLRLGVVGQVKVGKSSLLNLLLFNGKEVLPKAATPMTASLTHITKSDREEIKVEYYTKEDWERIQDGEKEYQRIKEAKEAGDHTVKVPDFAQVSHELLEMTKARGLRVSELLGRTDVHVASVPELNSKLTSLVGAGGSHTPLVKSVSICCGRGVPELDIVDTPGLNDPISSRSTRTKKMLAQCDAVLLLSYAGQMMDSSDVKFFNKRLRAEGINDRLIIGSKFDSVLIGAAGDYGHDLQSAIAAIGPKLRKHAKNGIAALSDEVPRGSADPNIIFVSAMCAKLADTPYCQWNDEEKKIFETMREAYPDWIDPADELKGTITEATKDILVKIGNRSQVNDHLDELREKKTQKIFASNRDTVEAKRVSASNEVEELLKELRSSRARINETTVEDVERQMKEVKKVESRLAVLIADEWHMLMEREVKPLDDLRRKLRTEAREAREELQGAVETKTKTKTERVEKSGIGNAIARFFWDGGYETVTETYTHRILNISAVESTVESVYEIVKDELRGCHDQMFTDGEFVRKSCQKLSSILANQLSNDAAQDYDVDMLRVALRDAISTTAANARSKLKKGRDFDHKELNLSRKAVDAGLEAAGDAISSAMDDAIRWIDRARDESRRITKEAEDALVPLAVGDLKKAQEQLKEDIRRRHLVTARIDSALREIEHGWTEHAEMGVVEEQEDTAT